MLDAGGRLTGVVSALAVEEQALAQSSERISAAALAHTTPQLQTDDPLEHAVRALARSDEPGLPVVAANTGEVVGWLHPSRRPARLPPRSRADLTDA